MRKTVLTKEEQCQAQHLSYYYRHPENISYDEKIVLSEAKAKNINVHFEALKINRQIWKTRKKR
jgi:hypothetical protein